MVYKTKNNNEQKKQISLYLDIETLKDFDNLSKSLERNRNDLLRLVIKDFIKNNKGVNNEKLK